MTSPIRSPSETSPDTNCNMARPGAIEGALLRRDPSVCKMDHCHAGVGKGVVVLASELPG